jgi:hypothetical protein
VVRNKSWWKKDEIKTTLAVKFSKKLEKEGLDPGTREFYDELDEKIREFIGEEDDTSDEQSLPSSSKEASDMTKKNAGKQSVVAGASRTPSKPGVGKGKVPVITLTKEERANAARMGISELDWAKNKYRQLKQSDENGYQSVLS